jgi:hypothetical protein
MSRVNRVFKLSGCLIKCIFGLIVAGVCAALLWRVFSSGDPKTMKKLSVNENVYNAYVQGGNDLYMFDQEQNSITRAENNYGYFSVTDCKFIPDANQAQIVFRYNNSTIRSLAEDYSLPNVPDRSEELYDVTLLLAIDLTPENTEDNATNDPASVRFVRVHASSYTRDTKLMYNYYRLVYDIGESGEDIKALLDSKLLLAVYADIYYVNDLDYEKAPYGTLCLYDYLSENKTVELERADKRELENFSDK